MGFFERRQLDVRSSSLSDEEGLSDDSVQLGSDVDFEMECFASGLRMVVFIGFFILATTPSR